MGIVAGAVVALLVVGFALSRFAPPAPKPSVKPSVIATPHATETPSPVESVTTEPSPPPDLYENYLRLGDCSTLKQSFSQHTGKVSCSESHHFEVIAEKPMTQTTIPEKSAISTEAEKFCRTQFASYIGISFDRSKYSMTYLYPSPDTWAEGDRLITCIAGNPDKTITGSIKGTKK